MGAASFGEDLLGAPSGLWSSTKAQRLITVAVLTYRRPERLAALLPLLEAQARECSDPDLTALDAATVGGGSESPPAAGAVTVDVEVLVVDNDPHGSAGSVVAARAEDPRSRARYVLERTPGIAAARNCALDSSAASDVLVFIDDDEVPGPHWLRCLLETYDRFDADAVAGPVRSHVDGALDPWVAAGGFFERAHTAGRTTGLRVSEAATNNLLLDLHTVRRLGLTFDQRYGLTGGEDSLFTRRLSSAGGRIVWSAQAAVVEIVPPERTTRDYAISRTFALANASTRVDLELAGRGPHLLMVGGRALLVSMLRLAVGKIRSWWGARQASLHHHARGRRMTARALGTLAALGGRYASPYGREGDRTDGNPTRRSLSGHRFGRLSAHRHGRHDQEASAASPQPGGSA